MDKHTEIIEKFISTLKDKSGVASSSGLYPKKWVQRPRNTYSTTDVISEVAKQMQAIQNADSVSSNKKKTSMPYKGKQSTFLTVNMLSREQPINQPSTSTATQCVSDTQLLNVVREAETVACTTTGITQEFDTTFCGNHEDVQDVDMQSPSQTLPILDISLKPPDPKLHPLNHVHLNKDIVTNTLTEAVEYNYYHRNVVSVQNDGLTEHDTARIGDINDVSFEENVAIANVVEKTTSRNKDVLNKSNENKNINIWGSVIHDSDVSRPSSPILAGKNINFTNKSPSLLVYDLKTFDAFEQIAMPVVERETEYETCKEIINSQTENLFRKCDENVPSRSTQDDEQNKINILSQSILQTEVWSKCDEHTLTRGESADIQDSNAESNLILTIVPETKDWAKSDEYALARGDSLKTHQNNAINKPILAFTPETVWSQSDQHDLSEGESAESGEHVFTKGDSAATNYNAESNPQHALIPKNIVDINSPTKHLNESKMTYNVLNDDILFSSDEEECLQDIGQGLPPTSVLNDDIIFSSDEEECLRDIIQVLPSTCFRDTSLSDDEANAIQVLTDSFNSDIQNLGNSNETKKVYTVTELVNIRKSKDKPLTSPIMTLNIAQIDKLFREKLENKLEHIKEDITKTIASDSTFDSVAEGSRNPSAQFFVSPIIETTKVRHNYENKVISQQLFEEFKENLPGNETLLADSIPKQIVIIHKTDELVYDENAQLSTVEIKDYFINKCEINTVVKGDYSCIDPNMMPYKEMIKTQEHEETESLLNDNDQISDQMSDKSSSSQIFVPSKLAPQKRKQAWSPISTPKRRKNKSAEETKIREILDGVNFDTCDLEEISMKGNAMDEIDSGYGILITDDQLEIKREKKESNQNAHSVTPVDSTTNVHDDVKSLHFKTSCTDNIVIPHEALEESEKVPKENFVESSIEKLAQNLPQSTFRDKPEKPPFYGLAKENKIKNSPALNLPRIKTETVTDNSEEPPFFGFLFTEEDKIKVLKEIESCKKAIEEEEFGRNSHLQNDNLYGTSQTLPSRCVKTRSLGNVYRKAEIDFKDSHQGTPTKKNYLPNTKHKLNDVSLFRKATDTAAKIYTKCPVSTTKILQNFDRDKDTDCRVGETTVPELEGFQIVSKKHMPATDLAKSRQVFQDIDEKDGACQNEKTVKSSVTGNFIFQEFQESVMNPHETSPKSLPKSKKNIGLSEKEQLTLATNHFKKHCLANRQHSSEPKPGKFEGFRTASNKQVIVSKEALAKSMKIFQDINSETLNQETKAQKFQGFVTASNKQVTVSEEALARSIKIFQDIHSEKHNNETKAQNFQGFVTASNKQVKVSQEALATSEKIFQDINAKKQNNELKAQKFQGFQTASNKEIKVSEEAFARSIKIFQDVNSEALNNEPNAHKFQGFQTASNKQVTVSEEALAKSGKIFQDMNSEKQYSEAKAQKFQGFQTASNKQVTVSEEALARSMKLFQDIHSETLNNESKPRKFQGFQTASNKQVSVSEEALAKGKKIFQDIHSETLNIEPLAKNFQGFRTASNKKVTVSEKALAKSEKIFQDINSETLKPQKFQGFQTASNKQVTVSEEALVKGKKIFQDIHSETLNIKPPAKNFQGFRTASNKQVAVSEEALAKSEKIFQDINSEKQNAEPKDQKFQGFQTASNKQVKVSEEAFARSIKIFQDMNSEALNNEPKAHKFQGFQTASNKQVTVSEKALAESEKIFKDINSATLKYETKPQKCQGFQTASNKQVTVSEEALAKSEKIFQGIEFDTPANEPRPEHIKGLATASHKQANVNETGNAWTESREILGNKDKKTFAEIESYGENIDNMINTQVLNNFEQTLHSDFFKDSAIVSVEAVTPKKNKLKDEKSGSPILSCPRSKKRKRFEIPYSQKKLKFCESGPIVLTEEHKKPVEVKYNGLKLEENYKKIKKYTLQDLAMLEANDPKENAIIDSYILNFDLATLLSFEFCNKRNDIDETTLNVQDLTKIFEESVNKKLIPKGWIEIHMKLILWKLISYEIKFPKAMTNVCTAKNVLAQLKYRYDKELFNAERPALRKVLEKDDVPSKTLILCVAAIFVDGVQVIRPTTKINLELLLTDGWYLIKATTDELLARMVCESKVVVGTKLVINGAELVGGEQGVAPWEDTSAFRLKLSGNSTRRARWDARLGYHGNVAILTRLSAVKPDGGKVSKLRTFVARVYPALYIEKFEDGSTVTRSERLEHIHQAKHETDQLAVMERLYEQVEKELADEDSQSSVEEQSTEQIDSGSQIARNMHHSKDPQEFRHNLSSTQQNLLESHEARKQEIYHQRFQERVQDKMSKAGLSAVRNVVPLLKVRVAGVDDVNGSVEVTKAMLSIWKPNDAIREIVTEGAWIEVMNVLPTAVRYSEMHLSAGRQTIFIQSKFTEPEKFKPHVNTLKRTCYPLNKLVHNPCMKTDYNEVDTVGFIFQIDPENKHFDASKQQFQNVYLADSEMNIICVNFWGGLKKFGFENLLETCKIVACMNLQKRAGNTKKNIPQYRATEFSYFTKTPRNDVARDLVEELSKKMAEMDRNKFCADCKSLRSTFSAARLQSNYGNVSPYRFSNIDMNLSKNIDTPVARRSNTDETDEPMNLTGLDFESTFKQPDTQELSPRTLLRKQRVKEKLNKLKMYGEPPPLSPITILNKSKNAGKAYKSPLIPTVTSEKRILPKEEKSEDRELSSPVLGMHRMDIKPNVQPVKLNFSKNIVNNESDDERADHFAEHFDGSPPLSLD